MGRVRVLLVVAVMFGSSGCLWMARSSVPSDPAAVQGNGASTRPALSQGGRYVAFESVATNLVAGDTNGVRDVFVRGGLAWGAPSLSDDGTRVAYGEFAAPDQLGNSTYDAVIADTDAATVMAIVAGGSLSHQGQSYFEVVLSGDGTAAAFTYSNFQIGTLQRFDVTLGQLVPVLDDLAGPGASGSPTTATSSP
jgi:hypothetical protein